MNVVHYEWEMLTKTMFAKIAPRLLILVAWKPTTLMTRDVDNPIVFGVVCVHRLWGIICWVYPCCGQNPSLTSKPRTLFAYRRVVNMLSLWKLSEACQMWCLKASAGYPTMHLRRNRLRQVKIWYWNGCSTATRTTTFMYCMSNFRQGK